MVVNFLRSYKHIISHRAEIRIPPRGPRPPWSQYLLYKAFQVATPPAKSRRHGITEGSLVLPAALGFHPSSHIRVSRSQATAATPGGTTEVCQGVGVAGPRLPVLRRSGR